MAKIKNYQWFILTKDIFSDEKIRFILKKPDGCAYFTLWIKLLAQAAKTNAQGYIYMDENTPYDFEMLGIIFDMPTELIEPGLKEFQKLNMITVDENGIFIRNWCKHQRLEDSEKLEKSKEANRQRQKRYRDAHSNKNSDNESTESASANTNEILPDFDFGIYEGSSELFEESKETPSKVVELSVIPQPVSTKARQPSASNDIENRRRELDAMMSLSNEDFLKTVEVPDQYDDININPTYSIDDLLGDEAEAI